MITIDVKLRVQHKDGRIETIEIAHPSRSWKVSNWTESSARMGWSTFSQKKATTTAGARVRPLCEASRSKKITDAIESQRKNKS
jgi:hypothetical protein